MRRNKMLYNQKGGIRQDDNKSDKNSTSRIEKRKDNY